MLLFLSFLEITNPTGWVRHTVRWCCDLEIFHLWLLHVLIVHFWPLKGSVCNVIECVVIFFFFYVQEALIRHSFVIEPILASNTPMDIEKCV